MIFGSGTYGSVEYAGLGGILDITGACDTTSSGESCSAVGSTPILETGGGYQAPIYGVHPRVKQPKRIKGTVFAEQGGQETFASGSVDLIGQVTTRSGKLKAKGEAVQQFEGAITSASAISNRKASGELIFSGTVSTEQAENQAHILVRQQFEATVRTKSRSVVTADGQLAFSVDGEDSQSSSECTASGNVTPRITGSGSTTSGRQSAYGHARVRYAYKAKIATIAPAQKSYGHAFAEDLNAKDEEELISILSML